MKQLIDRLEQEQTLPREDWIRLLEILRPKTPRISVNVRVMSGKCIIKTASLSVG